MSLPQEILERVDAYRAAVDAAWDARERGHVDVDPEARHTRAAVALADAMVRYTATLRTILVTSVCACCGDQRIATPAGWLCSCRYNTLQRLLAVYGWAARFHTSQALGRSGGTL